jgi:multiple sugar transport system substrate-binding protein
VLEEAAAMWRRVSVLLGILVLISACSTSPATQSPAVSSPSSAATAAGSSGGSSPAASSLTDKGPITFWTAEDNADRVKAMQAIVDKFTAATGVQVKLVAIAEDQLPGQVTSAAAAGTLPDVFGAISLGTTHTLAATQIIDPDAAGRVIQALGQDTFSKAALALVSEDGKPVAVPSDSWAQLLVYRKDLFQQNGLATPDTFDAILAASQKLNAKGMAGIVASTGAADSFTQQTFEYFAVANGCQAVDNSGAVTLTSQNCVDTFKFYQDMIKKGSHTGGQDADTTRADYFAGKAAMIVWSSFLLDELAGLRNDALPTCTECKADATFLAKNSGIVTAIKGPDASASADFGELVSFAITKGGQHQQAAEAFVQYMMSDGYVDWLALAPEGKFPTRLGTADDPQKYATAWGSLQVGVDKKAPLSDFYPKETLDSLTKSTDTMQRWGFSQGQGRIVGPLLTELPIPKALADGLEGSADPTAIAQQAQAAVEEIVKSLQ